MTPKHSIGYCPICGGGLCGIRICGIDPSKSEERFQQTGSDAPHGLVVCDECDAIWLEPDTSTAHQYPDPESACCPICNAPLWGDDGRWASQQDIQTLGWQQAVNPELDATSDEQIG